MRPRLVVIIACLATVVPVAGCGSGRHRVANGAVCAYSVWRGTHDARTHHYFFAAFQAWLAIHHCPRALGR